MENTFDNIKIFFEKFIALSFWQRIFGWGSIKKLSYDAFQEFKNHQNELNRVGKELLDANHSIELLKNEGKQLEPLTLKLNALEKTLLEKSDEISLLKGKISSNNEAIKNFENQIKEKNDEIKDLKRKVEELSNVLSQIKEENTRFKQTEELNQKNTILILQT